MKKLKQYLITIATSTLALIGFFPSQAFADMDFSVSPMSQRIILTPEETYNGTFEIINPVYNGNTFHYKLSVEPFSVDENYNPIYENNGDYNQIVDWIKLESETGSINANETARVNFSINTPESAPAGGQYAIIRVSSNYDMLTSEEKNSLNIQNVMTIAHILYAEVAGETNRSGEILNTSVPGFLFSGDITGTATIKNTGNVHSDATMTLQVYPLFSGEEVYTNEEAPLTSSIIPEATRTKTLTWEDTPSVGIFHVVFNADFEGAHSTIDKYVIVCPLWLLLLIFLALFLLIFRILSAKRHPKSDK